MKLREFAGILPVGDAAAADLDISGMTSDSRQVKPGFLFAALQGSNADGAAFIADAAAKGAAAVVAAPEVDIPSADIPVLTAADPRRALSLMAAQFYGRQPHTMVAVTGTAGKTSVASVHAADLAICRVCGCKHWHDRCRGSGPQ